jgi:hypothetical protein
LFDSTFAFTIDNHWLQVISADFVPTGPHFETSVLIGIGQRYNVILEARPEPYLNGDLPTDGNFWIRTYLADNCFGAAPTNTDYMKTGILRYDPQSIADPTTTKWPNISTKCSDEPYESLVPKLPRNVSKPANGVDGEQFNIISGQSTTPNYPIGILAVDRVEDPTFEPLMVDWSDPIFHFNDTIDPWPPAWLVVPENYTAKEWVSQIALWPDRREER